MICYDSLPKINNVFRNTICPIKLNMCVKLDDYSVTTDAIVGYGRYMTPDRYKVTLTLLARNETDISRIPQIIKDGMFYIDLPITDEIITYRCVIDGDVKEKYLNELNRDYTLSATVQDARDTFGYRFPQDNTYVNKFGTTCRFIKWREPRDHDTMNVFSPYPFAGLTQKIFQIIDGHLIIGGVDYGPVTPTDKLCCVSGNNASHVDNAELYHGVPEEGSVVCVFARDLDESYYPPVQHDDCEADNNIAVMQILTWKSIGDGKVVMYNYINGYLYDVQEDYADVFNIYIRDEDMCYISIVDGYLKDWQVSLYNYNLRCGDCDDVYRRNNL